MHKRKKLKLAMVSACAAASAVQQVVNLNPASSVLQTNNQMHNHTEDYMDPKCQEEEDELNSIFFHSAMLSCSLALGGTDDDGWWVKPRVPAWFDKFLVEVNDRESWFSALSMSKETFLWICDQLRPLLNKKVTRFRYPIPVTCRLGAAVYRLTTGADLQVISEKFGIGVSSSQSCITDTVKAINQHFSKVVSFSDGDSQLEEVVEGFFEKCELVSCAGAIGITNVQVMPSSGLDSTDCSIWVQGVCDTSYRFMDVQCGTLQEFTNPEGLGLVKTRENLLAAASAGLEEDDPSQTMYYLVGNGGYPLLPWLLVPYQESEMPMMASSFNKRHALGAQSVKATFAILKQTFKILSKCVKHNVAFVPKLISACCILHNILLKRREIPVDLLTSLPDDPPDEHFQAELGTPDEVQGQEYRDYLAELFFRRTCSLSPLDALPF